MFYEKALINNITLSYSLDVQKWRLSSAKGLYLSKGGTIKLEFICCRFVLRGGGYIFYYVVSFVNRCALHSKLHFHSLVYEMFRKQIEFWL